MPLICGIVKSFEFSKGAPTKVTLIPFEAKSKALAKLPTSNKNPLHNNEIMLIVAEVNDEQSVKFYETEECFYETLTSFTNPTVLTYSAEGQYKNSMPLSGQVSDSVVSFVARVEAEAKQSIGQQVEQEVTPMAASSSTEVTKTEAPQLLPDAEHHSEVAPASSIAAAQAHNVQALQREITSLNAQLADKDTEIEAIALEKQQAEAALATANQTQSQEIVAHEQAIDALRAEVAERDARINDLQTNEDTHLQSISDYQARVDTLINEKEQFQVLAETLERNLEEQQHDLVGTQAALNVRASDLAMQVASLEQQLAEKNNEIAILRLQHGNISEYVAHISELESANSELMAASQLNGLTSDDADQIANLTARVIQLQEDNESINSELDTERLGHQDAQGRIQALEQQNQALQQQSQNPATFTPVANRRNFKTTVGRIMTHIGLAAAVASTVALILSPVALPVGIVGLVMGVFTLAAGFATQQYRSSAGQVFSPSQPSETSSTTAQVTQVLQSTQTPAVEPDVVSTQSSIADDTSEQTASPAA